MQARGGWALAAVAGVVGYAASLAPASLARFVGSPGTFLLMVAASAAAGVGGCAFVLVLASVARPVAWRKALPLACLVAAGLAVAVAVVLVATMLHARMPFHAVYQAGIWALLAGGLWAGRALAPSLARTA